MTRGDRWLLAGLFVLSLLPWLRPAAGGAGEGPVGYRLVLLDPPQPPRILASAPAGGELVVRGRLGDSVLRFDPAGRVCFHASPCPNPLCVKSGWSRPGETLCCVPNGVAIT